MSVLNGPREEWRRILHKGQPQWVRPAGEHLLPGDISLTETPKNSRPMNIGDIVEVEISGIGRLLKCVAEIPPPAHTVGHQPTDSEAVRRVTLGPDFRRGEA